MIVVVMGVSGCGKSTVGQKIAERLGCAFRDGDEFHSDANRAKMHAGIPLNDDDRKPWLEAIRAYMDETTSGGRSLVVACSALKQRYRDVLRGPAGNAEFVYLKGASSCCKAGSPPARTTSSTRACCAAGSMRWKSRPTPSSSTSRCRRT